MKPRIGLLAGTSLYRFFCGRLARRAYLALFLLVIAFSTAVRIRTYLLTRRIHDVLSGLEQVHVDTTTENQLLKAVPSLLLAGQERHTQLGVERVFLMKISNEDDIHWMRWVPGFLFSLWPPRMDIPVRNKWDYLDLPSKAVYLLGWRQLVFTASVSVLNGTVSSTAYDLEPDVRFGFPVGYLVVARSVHGFFARRPVPVHVTDDESPDFRFGMAAGEFSWQEGADNAIAVAYTPAASSDLVSHAFHVDLHCFWGMRGCDSVRQVTPLLWKDRQAIVDAATVRLSSPNPCPDRILAGRVRTLLDLNVALLEVLSSRSEEINYEGARTPEIVMDYRLREAVRGQPQGPWTNIRYRQAVPWPLSPTGQIPNPIRPSYPKPGDRFLYFSGANFDSCRIVPATPSAESAVRMAIPAHKRSEDDIGWMWGRH
jgi:hypothetical protein